MVQKWNDEGIIELHTLGLNEKCFSKYIISLKSIVPNLTFDHLLRLNFLGGIWVLASFDLLLRKRLRYLVLQI